ncbi:MAG: cyclic nucleotide-binding domain-containing protein [Desulforhabdus sp.]|nr:cyclic nucleotide-binding domain-containing protein [Desulforhabdus sp.]
MYLPQADLFHGMNRELVREIMDTATKETYEREDVLFRKGEPATDFYIFLKGHVRLSLGETGQVVHMVSRGGEAFGWSSLVEREVYSATAQCTEPTTLLKIKGKQLQEITAKDPANGMLFFKRLAGILGRRLVQSYEMMSSASQALVSPSYGAGDLMETYVT